MWVAGTARAKGLNEGQRGRQRKSKPSESCSEHETQAREPQDDVLLGEVVICVFLLPLNCMSRADVSYIRNKRSVC